MRCAVAGTWTAGEEGGTPEAAERPGEIDPLDLAMAHELKNPLSAVKALVQLGLRNPAESAAHGRLAALEREVDRVQEILARHLSAARSAGRGGGPGRR
jgi:nitrogen-specific signal transduction histidine kinase